MRKAEEFLTAVFTAEGDVDDEARKIVLLLESGVDTVHIRKPGLDEAATAGLIESVPVALRHRLRLASQQPQPRASGRGGVGDGLMPHSGRGPRRVGIRIRDALACVRLHIQARVSQGVRHRRARPPAGPDARRRARRRHPRQPGAAEAKRIFRRRVVRIYMERRLREGFGATRRGDRRDAPLNDSKRDTLCCNS